MITKKYRSSFLIAVPFLAASMVCWGAGGEIEAFAGGSTFDQGGGSHGTFGLTGGMKVTSAWSVFGEFSWEQLASESDSSSGVNVNASVNLANLGGGVAYNFGPLSKKVFPYALVAGGVGHFYGSGSASGNGTSVSISMPLANAGYLGAGVCRQYGHVHSRTVLGVRRVNGGIHSLEKGQTHGTDLSAEPVADRRTAHTPESGRQS